MTLVKRTQVWVGMHSDLDLRDMTLGHGHDTSLWTTIVRNKVHIRQEVKYEGQSNITESCQISQKL